MREAVVVASSRTGLAKSFRGSFNITRPEDLAAHCIKDVLRKVPQLDAAEIDDVVLGCAQPHGPQSHNIARTSAMPPSQSEFGGLLTFPLGAYHSAEIPYLFKTGNLFGLPELLSPKQRRLSHAMVSYWTQFAKTGDPNSSGEPLWPPYSASTDQFQSLIPPVPVVESNFDSSHQCSTFWDTF